MTDLVRQEIAATADTLVVKIGTRPLTNEAGTLDEARVAALAEELHAMLAAGRRVLLVSSGAVGAGMGQLGLKRRPTDLANLQAVAAIGQSYLVQAYERALRAHGRHAAQVLLTAEDLDDRTRYLNVRNTLSALLDLGAVPIINENDTVSVEELRTTFGDNDRLAAMVTNLLRAPLLVILSDVAGLYDGDPFDPASKVIPTVSRLDESIVALVRDRATGLSKGGMASKLEAARICTSAGENVIVASGREPGVLSRILAGESVGTLFLAHGVALAARKRWIGFTAQPRGHLVLDAGARRAVERQGRSLLPIGVAEVVGTFVKGDVVALRDHEGVEFARGLTNYGAADLLRIKGLKSEAIAAALGYCPYQEVIHRDNLLVTTLAATDAAK
ncbi:MAG: glutamate 5-kinase [Pirellulales bacterium]|nr:glutamate 5-kinase [Pirellulales bacterium]